MYVQEVAMMIKNPMKFEITVITSENIEMVHIISVP